MGESLGILAANTWKNIASSFILDTPSRSNPHDPKYGQGSITNPARGNPHDPKSPLYQAPGPPAYVAPTVPPASSPTYGDHTAENAYHDQLLNSYKPNTNFNIVGQADPYKAVSFPGSTGAAGAAGALLQKIK